MKNLTPIHIVIMFALSALAHFAPPQDRIVLMILIFCVSGLSIILGTWLLSRMGNGGNVREKPRTWTREKLDQMPRQNRGLKKLAYHLTFFLAVSFAILNFVLFVTSSLLSVGLLAAMIFLWGLSRIVARLYFFGASCQLLVFEGLHAATAKVDPTPTSQIPVDPARAAAADRILDLLLAPHFEAEGRAHAQTVLTEVGALAGYASQLAAVTELADPAKQAEKRKAGLDFYVTKAKNGEEFFFGSAINHILFNSKHDAGNVWSHVAGAVPNAVSAALPNLEEIVEHTANTIGSEEFGVPRLPADHMPLKLPRKALNDNWGRIRNAMVAEGRKPQDWPLDLAVAAKELIGMGRDVVAPLVAAKIVMEAAIPMSKVDPRSVPEGWFSSPSIVPAQSESFPVYCETSESSR